VQALSKIIRGDNFRPTRFHTQRGTLMSPRGFLQLPGSLLARWRGSNPDVPWLVPAAIPYIANRLRPDWAVLELGAGGSTVWFARRVARVTSLEHDPRWFAAIRERLHHSKLDNCELRLHTLDEYLPTIRSFEDRSFDLVLVDNGEMASGDRVPLAIEAAAKLRDGGLLVLDNSDRPSYRDADTVFRDWPVRRFTGTCPRPLTASETSVFVRPAP
jgi:precorrin-6B methylase 2